jgi:hypothetical protein
MPLNSVNPIFCDTTNVQIYPKSDLSADLHYQIDDNVDALFEYEY